MSNLFKILPKKLIDRIPENNRLERIWKIAQVDFQARYYNDRLGLLWALIKPIFEACLYYVAFKYFLGFDKDGFVLFLFGGLVTWMAFSEGSARSISLLKSKSYLIENVQFNHVDLFFSHVTSIFFAFFFNFSAFILIAIFAGEGININYLYLPVLTGSLFLITLGVSLILATIQPFLKDITHLWDMALLTGFWVSGVIFEPDVIFERATWFAYVNPFLGIIQNIRAVVIESYDFSIFWLGYTAIISIIIYFIGIIVFKSFGKLALEKL